MTPSQYEQRCAEMLRANAHNMTPEEIERMAYGANDAVISNIAFEWDMAEAALLAEDDDA